MNRKKTALLLSALVLPGLGQLYLGRKAVGIAIIMAVNLLLLLTLFVLVKGLAPVIATKLVSGGITPQEILAALHGMAGFGKALLAGFALLWAISIIDIIKARENTEAHADNQAKA
jgi:TM2 domain-containing membrane protein YozV